MWYPSEVVHHMVETLIPFISPPKTLAGIAGNQLLETVTLMMPAGFRMHSVELQVNITPTGSAGTGTSPTSAVIKAVRIKNENAKNIGNFNSGLALALAAAKSGIDLLDSTAPDSNQPTKVGAAYDQDGILAANAQVNSIYRLVARFPGQAADVTVSFFLPTLAGYGTQPTSYIATILVVAWGVATGSYTGDYEGMVGLDLGTNTRFEFDDPALGKLVRDATIWSTTQLDTNITAYRHGTNSYESAAVAAMERSGSLDATIAGVVLGSGTYFLAKSVMTTGVTLSVTSQSLYLVITGRVPL